MLKMNNLYCNRQLNKQQQLKTDFLPPEYCFDLKLKTTKTI